MDERLERLASETVDAAVKVHILAGPGLLESVYEKLLAKELKRRGLRVDRQRWISATLDGIRFERAFRADLLVESSLLVEVKSVEALTAAHWKQVRTYLRILDMRLGFLINFKEAKLKDGLKRIPNGYDGFAGSRLRLR